MRAASIILVGLMLAAGAAMAKPPSWDKRIDNGRARFKVLKALEGDLGGGTVLDKETGLVWERRPIETDWQGSPSDFSWYTAFRTCLIQGTRRPRGNRYGWRLPRAEELASLQVPGPSGPIDPGLPLPSGHPFLGVRTTTYWTATRDPISPEFAYVVDFSTTRGGLMHAPIESEHGIWCVRGGANTGIGFDGP